MLIYYNDNTIFLIIKWDYSSAGEHFVDIEGVTGSIPVSPTISTKIKYVRNNKDLACKLLKLLSYFYYPCLKRTYLILNTFLKNRSKLPPKSTKVSSKCLVNFSQGLQVMTLSVTVYFLKSVFLIITRDLILINYILLIVL